jgi:hypothetical protein
MTRPALVVIRLLTGTAYSWSPRASIYSLSARSRYVPAKIGAFNTFMERFFVGRIF